MKKLAFLLFLFTIGFNLYSQNSQSVYTLELRRDIAISTLAVCVFVIPFFINDDRPAPPILDRNDVNAFDRWLMFPYNRGMRIASQPLLVIGAASTFVPPLILGWGDQRGNLSTWLTYGVMFTQAHLLTFGTKDLIGRNVNRYRPMVYFHDVEYEGFFFRRSFPSGTTAAAFMQATFLSVAFSQEFPESRWRVPVIIGSHTLASMVGATRILSSEHFLTDILAGAAIGSFYGWLIPTLHRRTENDRVSFIPTVNGLIVSFRF